MCIRDRYLNYEKYVLKFSKKEYTNYFTAKSKESFIRVHWNVTLYPVSAVQVKKVVLEDVEERQYFMPGLTDHMYLEHDIGERVMSHFMLYEKHKLEDVIKRHMVEAIQEADIRRLVYNTHF